MNTKKTLRHLTSVILIDLPIVSKKMVNDYIHMMEKYLFFAHQLLNQKDPMKQY